MAESDETAGVRGEPDAASRPWNVLAMATFAPLGEFSTVRLTPQLTRADLGIAGDLVFPRAPGEFLVGVIRQTFAEGVAPILLTNHKVVWFERLPPGTNQPTFAAHGASYHDVGPHVVVATEGGDPAVDLGDGRVITTPVDEPALAAAFASALGTLARAAQTGEAPPIEADLARRIVATIPKAVEVDASFRIQSEHRTRFRDDLLSAAPRAYVTRSLVAACVLVYAAMTATGVDPVSPSTRDMIAWGANDDLRVALGGEWPRLVTSVFLHIGVIHLAFNMWALVGLGPLVERLYGSLRFATLYLAAGVGGSVASMATPPVRTSAGASGAIFGIMGALLAFLIVRRHAVPSAVLKPLRSQALSFVVLNVGIGWALPMIDQAAHLGGLAVGFLAGLALAPAWPRKAPTAADTARSAAFSILVALAVSAATIGAIHWRARTIGPEDQIREYAIQVQPVSERLREAARANREVVSLLNDREKRDESARRLDELLDRLGRQGRENLKAAERIWTPDPKLAEAVALLAAAQREQIASIDAVRKFRETNDLAWLQGDDGFLERVVELKRLLADRRKLEEAYLRDNGLPVDEEGEEP